MAKITGKLSQMISSIEWEIEDFSSLSKETGDTYYSPEFKCYDGTWSLTLYPNGVNKDSSGFISLYLKLNSSSNSKRNVHYTLSIKKIDGTDYITKNTTHEFYKTQTWGWTKFMERSVVLKDMNDILKISCVISFDSSFPDESFNVKSLPIECGTSDTDSLQRIAYSLENIFINQINSDITITVQEQQIPAHKLILLARSSVFADMLQQDTEENKKGILEITGFKSENVQDFLLYLYCGYADKINLENVFELYALSDKFYVEDLKTKCVEFLKQNLSSKNVCDVLLFAEKHNEVLLGEAAKRSLAENASDILPSENWKKFRNENNSITLDTLQSIVLAGCMKVSTVEKI